MPFVTIDDAGRIVWTDPSGNATKYRQGDIAWMLAATALVWIMTPGVGFLYSGFLQRKNALSMIFLSMAVTGVVTFQWWVWGFSLAFSDSASSFYGNFKYIGLRHVFENPSITSNSAGELPAIVYCVFQLTFACITPVLAMGAVAERGRLGPSLIFVFIWSTLVYDPIACWTWNSRGWSHKGGVLDFAGGTVVHINAGATALAISLFLGKRFHFGRELVEYPPHNTTYIALGTVMLWFGWFGFNGGSALGANIRAAQACFVTTLSASIGGLSWMALDCIRDPQHRLSVVGYCSGAISALVAITPGSGFVGAPAAGLFGLLSGIGCNLFTVIMKGWLEIDDTLDIFSMHAIGGLIGNILTGIFAQRGLAEADGSTPIGGGWVNRHYVQLGWQLANSIVGMIWAFGMTSAILWGMHYVPGLSLRRAKPGTTDQETAQIAEEVDRQGIDELDLSEMAYDYVLVRKDIPPPDRPQSIASVISSGGTGSGGNGTGMTYQPYAAQPLQLPTQAQAQQGVPPPPPPPAQSVNQRSRRLQKGRDDRISLD